MTMCRNKFMSLTALVLAVMQVVLILFSWIISTVMPSLPVRSMISGEGVRWLLGGFTSCMASPLLVWLLVCSVAWGAFIHSGLSRAVAAMFRRIPLDYRSRHALITVAVLLCVVFFIVFLLSFVPHAVLLGVTGSLFPSAFSSGLIPLLAFTVTMVSVVYGVVGGELSDTGQVFSSLYSGVCMSAPLWPVYILAMQLYGSIGFVFY